MGVILPDFVDGPISATQLRVISDTIGACKSVADRPRPMSIEATVAAGATLTGRMIHYYDTLAWSLTPYAGVTLRVNGTTVTLTGDTGTASLTALGLTVGESYPVTITAGGSTVTVRYVEEYHSETYGSGPTAFTSGDSAATIVSNLNEIVDYTDQLVNLAQTPVMAFCPYSGGASGWDRENESIFSIHSWWFRYTHDVLAFKYYHSVQSHDTESARSRITIEVNSTVVAKLRMGTNTYTGVTATTENIPYNAGNGAWGMAENVTGIVDISGLSLSVGTWYKVEIKQEGTGTDHNMDLVCRVSWLSNIPDAPSWTTQPIFEHGDQNNIDYNFETYFNLWRTGINYLHPGAASPSSPLYFDNPVQWDYGPTKRHQDRRKPYLVYAPDSDGGTPQIFATGVTHSLKGGSGVKTISLEDVDGLFDGDRFYVDDVVFAQQVDDISEIT